VSIWIKFFLTIWNSPLSTNPPGLTTYGEAFLYTIFRVVTKVMTSA